MKKISLVLGLILTLFWSQNSWADVDLSLDCDGTKVGHRTEEDIDCDSNPQLKPGTTFTIEARCQYTDDEVESAQGLEYFWSYDDDEIEGEESKPDIDCSASCYYISSFSFTVPNKTLDSYISVTCSKSGSDGMEYAGETFSFTVEPESSLSLIDTKLVQSEIISTIESLNPGQEEGLEIDNPVINMIGEIEIDLNQELEPVTDVPPAESIDTVEANLLEKQQFDKTLSFVKAVLATLKILHLPDDKIVAIKDNLATVADMQGVADVLAEAAADKIGVSIEELQDLLMPIADDEVGGPSPFLQSVIYIAVLVLDEEAIDLLLKGDTSGVSEILPFVVKVITEKLK